MLLVWHGMNASALRSFSLQSMSYWILLHIDASSSPPFAQEGSYDNNWIRCMGSHTVDMGTLYLHFWYMQAFFYMFVLVSNVYVHENRHLIYLLFRQVSSVRCKSRYAFINFSIWPLHGVWFDPLYSKKVIWLLYKMKKWSLHVVVIVLKWL